MPGEADTPIIFRTASPDDCTALAHLYATCLPQDLACRLGEGFLSRLFRTLQRNRHTTIMIATQGTKPVGFCVVTADRQTVNREMLRHAITALACRPPLLLALAWQALHPSFLRSFFGQPDRETADWKEVYLIGVSPGIRGGGIGGRLLREALAVEPHVPCIAKTLSERASQFYQRHGFAPLGTEPRGSRTMNILAHRPMLNGRKS